MTASRLFQRPLICKLTQPSITIAGVAVCRIMRTSIFDKLDATFLLT